MLTVLKAKGKTTCQIRKNHQEMQSQMRIVYNLFLCNWTGRRHFGHHLTYQYQCLEKIYQSWITWVGKLFCSFFFFFFFFDLVEFRREFLVNLFASHWFEHHYIPVSDGVQLKNLKQVKVNCEVIRVLYFSFRRRK